MTIKAHNIINAPASVTLASGIAADATSLTVSADLGVTAPFKATFASTGEIIEVGVVSGTAWSSITRGAEETTAAAYSAGTSIELRLTAGHLIERRPFNVYPAATNAENEANIAAAIADGYLSLAPGTYSVGGSSSSGAIFTVDAPIEIDGHGAHIVVDGATPNTCDLFRFDSDGYTYEGKLHIHDLVMYPATNLAGRHALHFNVVSSGFYGVSVHDCSIGSSTGWLTNVEFYGSAVKLTNPVSNNGFYTSSFRDIKTFGGFSLERLGDSVVFDGVTITSTRQIGFDVTLVENAGICKFTNCNVIAALGCMKIVMTGNSNVHISECNCEHVDATATTAGAIVYISGGYDSTIKNSRVLQINPGPSELHGLSLVNVQGSTVIGNQLQGYGTGYDLILDANSDTNYAPVASNRCFTGRYSNAGTTRAAI